MRGWLSGLVESTFPSLTIPDYRRVFFGNAAFQFGNWMQQIVFPWLLLTLGGSPLWLGFGGLSYAVSMITLGPLGGALADAFERRRVMMLTQLTAVVVNAGVALLLALHRLEPWHLLVAATLMGFSFTMNMPARQSIMAELVPRRLMHNATALHATSQSITRISGPTLAGLLMSALDALPVLLINLAANCWTVWQLVLVKHRPAPRRKGGGVSLARLAEGYAYTWHNPAMRQAMAIVAVSNFFGLSYVYLLPALAKNVLQVGPDGLGLLMSSMAGGALVGSLVLARLRSVPNKLLYLGLASTLIGVLLAALGNSSGLVQAAAVLALVGASSAAIVALGLTSIQEIVTDEVSGRVFGIYMQLNGLTPLGSLPASALATSLGVSEAIAIWGSACALLSAGLVGSRVLLSRRAARSARVAG